MLFLYLPDAVSLALLLAVLFLLRRAAVDHLRQELLRLRAIVLSNRTDSPVHSHRPFILLQNRLKAAEGVLAKASPARLHFVVRACRHATEQELAGISPALEHAARDIADQRTRATLLRIQLEFDISFGVFFLFGSLSGWIQSCIVFSRLLKRAFRRRSAERMDWFFDMTEKVLSRTGRHALRLALLAG